METSGIVVGLDIGTTKVAVVVGEVDNDGINIMGVGNVPCKGLRKGVVANIEWTVRAITEAVQAAQSMAGVEIRTVYASVSGSHVRSQLSDGVVAIGGGEVRASDVSRVLENARAVAIDSDRQVLHVLPREFTVDNQDGIRDPIGMSGVRLGVRVSILSAAATCVQNVVRCAQRSGLAVADVVMSPIASGEAVISDDEKEIGVAVIDIGGGTTDLLLYVDGGVAHASSIPAGGTNVTSDISMGLRTPMGEAERLKRNSGCALGRMIGEDEEIEVPGVGGHPPRKTARRMLSDIIEPRVEEIFAFARKRMEETGMLEQLSAGAVLTGGESVMEGMTEIAEEILGMPVRRGIPIGVTGFSQVVAGPQFATGVGLVRHGAGMLAQSRERAAIAAQLRDVRAESLPEMKSQSRVWSWFKQAF